MSCPVQEAAIAHQGTPSLRANFTWTFAGNLIYAGCQWGMISVLAKAGSAAVVGKFALGLAISAPVFMFTNLQLRAVQATDALGEYPFGSYFTLRLITTVAGASAIAGLVFASGFDIETRNVILLVTLSKSIECMSDVVAGLLQWRERLSQVAKSLMIRGGLSILSFGATFLQTHSLAHACAAMCAAWFIVLIAYDLPMARRALASGERYLHFNFKIGYRLFVLSLPLGIVMTLNSLNTNIPRYILEHYAGPACLGIFSSLAYVMVALNMLTFALCQSALTRLSVLFVANNIRPFLAIIYRLSWLGVAIIFIGVPSAIVCGRWALTLLYQPEYGEHVAALSLLVAATGINAVAFFVTAGLNAARSFRLQVPVYIASTISITVTCLWLAPRYQMIGAAISLVVGSLVWLAGSIWILHSLVTRISRTALMIGEPA